MKDEKKPKKEKKQKEKDLIVPETKDHRPPTIPGGEE